MNFLKNLVFIGVAAFVGYVIYKTYQSVKSASSHVSGAADSVSSGVTSSIADAQSALSAIADTVLNPFGLAPAPGASTTSDIFNPVPDSLLTAPAGNPLDVSGAGWSLVGNP